MRIFVGHAIQGYASLMVAILVIGGIQMIMLGVLANISWRTLERSAPPPQAL